MDYERKINPEEVSKLRVADFYEIEGFAKAQSDEAILLYYGIESIEELNDVERKFFKIAVHRGRMRANQEAIDSLFQEMKNGKNSVPACLSYLKRFSPDWAGDVDDQEGMPGRVSYRVDLSVSENKE